MQMLGNRQGMGADDAGGGYEPRRAAPAAPRSAAPAAARPAAAPSRAASGFDDMDDDIPF